MSINVAVEIADIIYNFINENKYECDDDFFSDWFELGTKIITAKENGQFINVLLPPELLNVSHRLNFILELIKLYINNKIDDDKFSDYWILLAETIKKAKIEFNKYYRPLGVDLIKLYYGEGNVNSANDN